MAFMGSNRLTKSILNGVMSPCESAFHVIQILFMNLWNFAMKVP